MARVDKQTRTVHVDDDAIEYTVTKHDEGYYARHDAAQDGHHYGTSGPWPTADEAARRYEQQILRERGGRTA